MDLAICTYATSQRAIEASTTATENGPQRSRTSLPQRTRHRSVTTANLTPRRANIFPQVPPDEMAPNANPAHCRSEGLNSEVTSGAAGITRYPGRLFSLRRALRPASVPRGDRPSPGGGLTTLFKKELFLPRADPLFSARPL